MKNVFLDQGIIEVPRNDAGPTRGFGEARHLRGRASDCQMVPEPGGRGVGRPGRDGRRRPPTSPLRGRDGIV
jgi:hypothetical protein